MKNNELEKILLDYGIDLPGTCCTNDECDGWHPTDDKREKEATENTITKIQSYLAQEQTKARIEEGETIMIEYNDMYQKLHRGENRPTPITPFHDIIVNRITKLKKLEGKK